ncbi:ECF-type sigma factor [Lacipirellula limnantheis]|nr:ECF-type sigma factor [Lacipirellula limnantheis]
MAEVTQLIDAIGQKRDQAAEKLLALVYDELRRLAAARIAHEQPGQTLQATALVHEAYLRLVGGESGKNWQNRGHFFAAAAEAMRRILIETARRKKTLKRGGQFERCDLEIAAPEAAGDDVDILAVNEALDELAREHAVKAELVKLRYFAGLTLDESASALGISNATADRYWRYARAWLAQRLRAEGSQWGDFAMNRHLAGHLMPLGRQLRIES